MREGAKVVICGRKQETLDQVASEIGPRCKAIACHVDVWSRLKNMTDTVMREFGRIDILVNNAGTNVSMGPSWMPNEQQFDKMIEINLKSAFRLIKASGTRGCVSEAPVNHQYRVHQRVASAILRFALQHDQGRADHDDAILCAGTGPQGVRVNAIAPGLVQTALSEYYWKDDQRRSKYLANQPIQRIGQPIDIAEAALLLASDRGSYMTGQTLVVDGGILLPTL